MFHEGRALAVQRCAVYAVLAVLLQDHFVARRRDLHWRGFGGAGLGPRIPCLFGRLRIGGRGGGAGDHGEPPLGVNFDSTSETAWAMRSCWFPPTPPIHQRAMSFVMPPRTRRTLMR